MAGRSDGGGSAASQTGSKARLRPSVPNLRPFKSCNPSHLPEISMDSNQLYLSPPVQQRSGYVSPLRTVRTIKEYDQEIEHLRKENFSLKLQLYFLEESIDKKFDLTSRDILKVNVQLKIETETLRTELNEKNRLLHNALSVMETQEKKHAADLKHSQEIQSKLEEQISSMKQALSRLQGIRDEGRYSEAYKLAFELEDSIAGKRVSDQEKSLDEAKIEREKLMTSVALKDEELQKANTRIEEQVNKIKDLEEKIRRRSIAIQGLVQMFKHKDDPKQPFGVLQTALQNAVEAATGGNVNTVIASMQEITAELNKLLISSGKKEFVDLSLEETNYLKRELSHKAEKIQALEAQLSQQNERVKTLEKNIHMLESGSKKRSQESTSTKEMEQECDNYYQAIREKDSFIQELLNERATIASEHEKTVQSLMSSVLNKDQALKNLEQKLKNGSLGEDYESLEIQEQFTGKEMGDFRKQIIDKLNAELAHCHEQLKTAKQESNSKDEKLIELSSRANQLENQLFQIQERLQELKKSHDEKEQSIEKYSVELEALSKEFITKKEEFDKLVQTLGERDKSLESWQKAYKDLENEYQKLKHHYFEHDLLHETRIEESDNKEKSQMFTNLTQVEDLQDSLKDSLREPVKTIDNQLCIIHSSETNADSELPENSNASSLSGINSINEPGNSFEAEPKTAAESLENNQGTSNNMPESKLTKDDLRISVCFKVKEKSIDSDLLLLQKMEYDKAQFEQEELQQEIKKQKNEMCKLERFIHEQEDIATALREDKMQLQLEVTEKTTEVNLLRLGCNELEQQVITLQGELHRTVAKADELERIVQENKGKPKGPLLKTSVFSQTEEAAIGQQSENILQEGENDSNSFESSKPQELMNPSLTTFGQSGDIGELKEEICVLVLTIEQKDKELQIQKKKIAELEMQLHEIQKEHISSENQFNTTYPPELVTLHHRLSQSHDVSSLLQQHLEELIKFFEQLLKYDGNGEFDFSFMTPENVSRFINFLGESLELSQNLMQNLTICEESVVFDHEEKASTVLNENLSEVTEGGQLSIVKSPPVSECTQQIESDESDTHDRKDQLEGRRFQVIANCKNLQNVNRPGNRRRWSYSIQHEPATEPGTEIFDSDQLVVLETSDSEDILLLLNDKGMPENVFLRSNAQQQQKEDNTENNLISNAVSSVTCNNRENCNGSVFKNISSSNRSTTHPQKLCWFEPAKGDINSCFLKPISNPSHSKDETISSVNVSHRNKLNYVTPFVANKESWCGRCVSSDSDIWSEPDRTISLQRIGIEVKLPFLQPKSPSQKYWTSRDKQATEDCSSDDTKSLYHVNKGRSQSRRRRNSGSTLKCQTSKNSLQECENRLESRLSNVEMFEKALDNKVMSLLDQFQKIQDSISELAQLKQQSYNSPNTLDNISDGIGCLQSTLIDAVKEVKMLKEIAAYPQDPSLVQEVKEHTEEILNKISDANQLKEILIKERRAREIAEQALSECREELASFKTELKQVNSDLLHEEKSSQYLISNEISFPEKLTEVCNEQTKINEMQKLQCQLVEEQENLIFLKKQKSVTENENKNLVIENENLQKCIEEDQKQIKILYKQITDLNNQTWKQKCELEQLHVTLKSDQEHLELISKEKNELDIKSRNLINGNVELQKQLEYEEKRLQQMMAEKSEISQKLYNETIEKQNLLDLVKQLENKNLFLEKESNKYKTDYESTDAMCIQLTNELKQIKDKLKKLEFKCRQCESDLSKVSDDKDNLLHGQQMLEEEVQSQRTKILELTKQNSEVKRRFQEKINDFNELEREKISVLDQLKKLQIEAKQMETSYQRLVGDNNDLTDKLAHLEHQLKDKELVFQKKEEHLKVKLSSYQDEIKQKELVIKDLERKIEILQEHINDQQLQQNQNAMALKELEEEKQNQASLYQKQLKKNDYQQRLADDKIEDLQDQIFHLKQQIKDKESYRKRAEDEKNDVEKELSSLKHDLRNKDSVQKQLKLKMKMLEDQVYDLQHQLMDKDLLINKLEEEKQNLKKNIIEKEQNINKIDSSSKTFEEKLFSAENAISELQQQLKDTETAKQKVQKENEDILGQMLHLQNEMKIKDIDLKKSKDEIKVLTNQLSVKEKWLNEKDKYYRKLEGEKEDFRKQTGSGSENNKLLSPQDNVNEIPTETESFYEKNFCSKASVTIATDNVTKEIQNKRRNYSLKSLSHNSNTLINDSSEIKTLQKELSIAKESILILEEEKKSLSRQIVNPPFKTQSAPLMGKLQEANDTYKKRIEELEQMIKKKDTFLREIKDDLHSSHILLLQNKAQFSTLETENLYYKKQVEALNEKLKCCKNEQNLQEEVEIYLTPEKMSDVQKELKSKITELEKGIKDQAVERKEIQDVNNNLLQENLNIKEENERLQQQLLDFQLILNQRPIQPPFTKPITDSLQEQLPDSHFMKVLEEKDLLFKKSVSLKKKLEAEMSTRKNLQKENEALKVALSSLQQKWQNNPVQEKEGIDKKVGNESMEYSVGPDADLNDAEKIRLEKQVSDLMQKLKEMESLNRSIQLELQAYQEMSQEKTHSKVASSDTEAVSQSLITNLLTEMRHLRAELGKVYNQNNLLRKKLDQTSLKMQSVGKITSKKVPVKGDHSSERESTPSSTDGTVTLSRSASLSHTSTESINRIESSRNQKSSKEKAEGLLSVRRHKKQYHDIDAHPTREKDGYFTSELQKDGAEAENLPESVVQRSHFSSPDLGIESDPNHDVSAPELLEREDNSHWRYRKSTQITPDIPAEFDNQVEDLHTTYPFTVEVDALQTILGSPLSKGSSLRAVGIVQDYELLKREMEESLVGIMGIAARVKDRLQSLVIIASPHKNMEYITLKAIHSSCHNVELCLQQAQRLVANFWVSTLPTSGEPADWKLLLKQNFEMKEQILLLKNQMSEKTKELQEAMVHLKKAQLDKDVIEKAIVKKLNKTKEVVKLAKRNLQERDRRYQLASQNQASQSSPTKP